MSLYEGIDADNVTESKDKSQWSSQIKLLQSQLHLKKTAQKTKVGKLSGPIKDNDTVFLQEELSPPESSTLEQSEDYDAIGLLTVENEYDPRYPNDYDKIMVMREEEKERERADEWRKDIEDRERRRKERYDRNAKPGREDGGPPSMMPRRNEEDEADEYQDDRNEDPSFRKNKMAAIAPPPSLLGEAVVGGASPSIQSNSKTSFAPSLENSVAARIMAKYGFREGQGLGKSEQGMSQALQVEKTSKRGGKILHENDLPTIKSKKNPHQYNPQFGSVQDDPSLSPSLTFDDNTAYALPTEEDDEDVPVPPALSSLYNDEEMDGTTDHNIEVDNPNIGPGITESQAPRDALPHASLAMVTTSIVADPPVFKTPSKVVLLRNMVGPGEVDPDLETETREECGKYGEVRSCVVFEIPLNSALRGVAESERVRIFVEFVRIESAIKAVVDINGRFFGGRIVRADYYNLDKFRRYDLGEGI